MLESILPGLVLLLWWLVIYHHLVFPQLLRWLGHNPHPIAGNFSDHSLPTITVVVPAYNEADYIAHKIYNLGALDYPAGKLDIIVACDGCTDNTADLAAKAASAAENRHLNVRIWTYPDNLGKTEHLNRVLPLVRSGVTALSDVSALISHDALRIAAYYFSDPEVGVVAGSYQLAKPGSEGEALYWRYQRTIKLGESILGAPIGVHGALYFYRTVRFRPLASDIINDDFVLPMQIVAAGSRAIYDPHIVALELESAPQQADFKRRSRIAAGNIQQLIRLPQLLHPRLGGIALSFASGKALRAVMPLILLLQFLLCFVLAFSSPWFICIALIQSLTIAFSLLRLWRWPALSLPGYVNAVCYLVCGYAASLNGVVRYLFGLERGRWQRVNTLGGSTHERMGD